MRPRKIIKFHAINNTKMETLHMCDMGATPAPLLVHKYKKLKR